MVLQREMACTVTLGHMLGFTADECMDGVWSDTKRTTVHKASLGPGLVETPRSHHNITPTAGEWTTRRGTSSGEVLRNGSLYSVTYQSDFRLITAVSKSAILCVPISVLISLEKRPIFRNSGFRYSGIGFPSCGA